jgi:hypothetical protein
MNYPKIKITIPPDFADRFPDGDYTVGRGADPRSAAERAASAAGKVAAPTKPANKRSKRKSLPPSEAAE